MTLLQDGRFALDKDTQTTFLSPKGELNLKVDNITLLAGVREFKQSQQVDEDKEKLIGIIKVT